MIDSYYDASAPHTPLAPDEEEIDVTPENPNANSAAGNANTKSGAVLNNLCLGGGSVGGGGGTQGPLAEVVVTGRRNVIISLRVFDRAHGGNGGGAGSGGNTRAMRDKPREVVSDQACANIDVARARAAYGALATAMGFVGMRAGQTFVARTTEVGGVAGYNETYIVVNTVVSPHAALVTTECPGGGG